LLIPLKSPRAHHARELATASIRSHEPIDIIHPDIGAFTLFRDEALFYQTIRALQQ